MPKEEKKVKEGKKVKEEKQEKHEKQASAVSVLYPGVSRFAYKTDKGVIFLITFKFKNIEPNTITYVVRLFLFVSKDVKKFIKEFSFKSNLSDHKIVDLIQQVSNGIFAKTPHNYENFNEQVSQEILKLPFVRTKDLSFNPSITLINLNSSNTGPTVQTITINNITYTTSINPSEASVTGNTLTTPTSVTIPQTIEDIYGNSYTVTSIGNGPNYAGAFQYSTYLTSITLPYTIQNISKGGINFSAFTNCINLTNVTFSGPYQITSIGDYAFNYCSALKTISIPYSVINLGQYAFAGCTSLTTVFLPQSSGITTINNGTFAVCTSLSTISVPISVTSINDGAFQGCTNLNTITIYNTVTKISSSAFQGCVALKTSSNYGTLLTNSKSGYVYNYFYPPGTNGFYVNIYLLLTFYFSDVQTKTGYSLLSTLPIPLNPKSDPINPGQFINYSYTIPDTDSVTINGPFSAILSCSNNNTSQNTIVTISNITVTTSTGTITNILRASSSGSISKSAINTPVYLNGIVLYTQLPAGSTLTVTVKNVGTIPFIFNTESPPVLSLINFTLA
jgi:hypothetical protein